MSSRPVIWSAPAPLDAWLAAVGASPEGVCAVAFVGETAFAARTSFCSVGCRALPLAEWGAGLSDAVRGAHWRVDSVAPRSAPLHRGHIVWFASRSCGMFASPDRTAESPAGWRRRVTARPPSGASAFLVRRVCEPRGAATTRRGLALLGFAAHALRPSVAVLCRECGAAGGVGAVAYGLLADALSRSQAPGQASDHAAAWARARRVQLAYLRGVAGAGQRPHARRAAAAAAMLARELDDHLEPAAALLRRASRRSGPARAAALAEAASVVREAEPMAREVAYLAAASACLLLNLPAPVARLVTADPDDRLAGTDLREAVYQARAGIAPLRILAARRLGASRDPQAVSTLGQLLWADDAAVSQTAAWALGRMGTDAAARALSEYRRAAEASG